MHFGFDGFGGFGMIFFWILIIGAVAILIKVLAGSVRGHKFRDKTALEILNERYAAGEINREEFESKKRDLVDK